MLLPLLVAAITVPIVAAFVLGGPPAGLAVGALAAALLIIVAARKRPRGPIEVARAGGERPRLLLVIDEAIDEPAAVGAIAEEVAELEAGALQGEPEVLVLSPARNRPLAHWLSDVDEARLEAQRRLVLTVGSLLAAGLDARGEVGDPEAVQAIEDALRRFAADEVVLMASEEEGGAQLLAAELRERLRIPVRRVRPGVVGSPRRSAPS